LLFWEAGAMTFNQLVWKMAKRNKEKYIFYYLCNSFAVMFFFMFSTVYFNDKIEAAKELEGIQDALTVPGVALVVFTVFFINNAHRIFTRKRRREFGLLMTLGMSGRDICKLLLVENGVIAGISIISGILTGSVFSRLYFLLLMNMVGMGEVPFHLSSRMFTYTITAFLLVFLVSVGITLYLTFTGNITNSLKSDRFSDSIKMRSPMMGGIGVALVIGSAIMLYITYLNPEMGGSGDSGGFLLMWTIAIIIGLYIALSQCMSFFIEVAKKHTPFYYQRLLFFSSLEYKFKQLTAILLLVTVMGMVTIFYSTLLLFIYTSTEKQVMERNPFDIAFVQTDTKNNISDDELFTIVDTPENPMREHVSVELYDYYVDDRYYENIYYRYTFMPLSDFISLTGYQKKLSEGEYLYLINSHPEYAYSNSDYENGLSLTHESTTLDYYLKDIMVKKTMNDLNFMSNDFLIINDAEFDKLKKTLPGEEVSIHLINTAQWEQTVQVAKELQWKLEEFNTSTPPFTNKYWRNSSDEFIFELASKVTDYHFNRNSTGMVFFVSTFVSVLFFFGSFILLYLNIFSSMEQDKVKYKKLFRIGITKQELLGIISKELMVLFFFAPLLGSSLALLYIVVFAKDVGGIMQNSMFFLNFLLIAGIYLTIQTIYYFFTRKKVLQQMDL
jgi:hypothetical protein